MLTCLETHVETFYGMCQCSNRDVVNTTFRIVAYRVEGNTTARFGLVTTTDNLHRLLRVGHGEVIEHDAVHATTVEHLLELIEVTHLDLYLQVETFFLEVCMTAVDGVGNTAGEIHMVIRIPGVVLRVSSTLVCVPSSRFT